MLVLTPKFFMSTIARMELAALAYLADQLETERHPLACITRVVLNGRTPTQTEVQALHDRPAEVVDLDQQLGA